jgi:hypothetical protein
MQEEKPVREAWMTELPDKLVNYGLGPRQFRRTAAPDRDAAKSAWTESPLDRQKKVPLCFFALYLMEHFT